MTLLMADDGVPPAYQGTKPRKQTYQFTFQMRDGNIVMGSGRWTGPSEKDHPDFAWYPYRAVATNPEVSDSPADFLGKHLKRMKDIGQHDTDMLFSSASDEISAERRGGKRARAASAMARLAVGVPHSFPSQGCLSRSASPNVG